MPAHKDKQCEACGAIFTPTGQNSKYCKKSCRSAVYKASGKYKMWRDDFNRKNGVQVGIGSGGTTKTWEGNPAYTDGRGSFRNHARRLKDSGSPCNRCGRDLRNVKRGEWAGHHIDHNPKNNVPENCELLCKACHQQEHDAGKYLPSYAWKLQRLSNGRYALAEPSRVGTTSPEAPGTQ